MLSKKFENHEPKSLLKEKIIHFFSREVHDLPEADKKKFIRLEVSIETVVEPLIWLQQQTDSVKTYWSDRKNIFSMAGVGEADVVSGQNSIDYSVVVNRLRKYLSDSCNKLRYYGGISFMQKRPADKIWQEFGNYRFLIPRFEVYNESLKTSLACNFILKESEDYQLQLNQILYELDQLIFSTPSDVKKLPLVVGRKDLPDKSGWYRNIKAVLASFAQGKTAKIVLARKSTFEFVEQIDPLSLLLLLKRDNSQLFHFCFQPSLGNAFIGGSPERLYHRLQGMLETEAVAGTRTRGKSLQEDQKLSEELLNCEKDIREHQFVVRSLRNILQQLCHSVELNREPTLLKLKAIQHLYTPCCGILFDDVSDAKILPMLHPTPAVGGYPKEQALIEIEAIEPFDRGWYAGPVGWVGYNAAEFAVAIRSGLVEGNQLSLFSGAGIVQGSEPDAEWEEIENKITNFLRLFEKFGIQKLPASATLFKLAKEKIMRSDASNINNLWGDLIIEELMRNRIDYFVISLGSRSTPLTVAVARNPRARSIICLDERSAAFHAIGYARATGNPAAIISTSGTAVANYFPAVIEASVDTIPMIVLSADRPPELRQTGASQTIQQVGIYGHYVKWQFDLPCPDEKIPSQMVLTTVDQAVYQARKSPCGPVHLNCMFRDPLAPQNAYIDEAYLASPNRWQEQQKPYSHYTHTISLPNAPLQALADIINQTQRGILAVGRLKSDAEIKAVSKLAQKLNWPVFADVRSGIRLGDYTPNVIPYFDQLLLTDCFSETHPLPTVLQIGDRITSKRFLQLLEKHQPPNYIAVIDDPFRHDPAHNISLRVESSIPHFCELLFPMIGEYKNPEWVAQLTRQSQLVNQVIDDFLSPRQQISEPSVARLISRHIPRHNGLFLASSMPIRDMDMYAATDGPVVSVAANRGTSGIEGTVASAAGFVAGLNSPVTLLIGDLAFLYDLNSLSLLKSLPQPLIVVVINNDGGGIFSFLPIANFQDVFEPYFGASHGLNFEHVSQMFGLDYYHPQTTNAFIMAYQSAITNHRSAVIEVVTDRKENFCLHQEIQKKIISAVEKQGISARLPL